MMQDWTDAGPVSDVLPVVPGGLKPVLREDGDGEGGGVLVLVAHAAHRDQVRHLNSAQTLRIYYKK
jgi:hypothetical protein